VAVALKIGVGDLILELLTHTLGSLCALPAAGTVSTGALESFSDGIDNLLIGIELDFHVRHLFLDCGFIIPQDKAFFCDEVTLIKKSGAF
jgi:hypothetical protein